ncbi:hypothetical protein BS47DRAFT_569644 [Hydnum rufescens UP504]|uniref:DUF6534 domain-containing protein n=1 Tax=Hydnum rufescens UP504 TaxID=1448309 RepID=A0A9P6B6C5_9AGAM|nr:hypothetical protein BS47DRAFT_569644 [Hydnum rufescens UP504]
MGKANLTLVNILGGAFSGNLLAALCLGVLTAQTSSYYHVFPDDRRPVKLVVGFLWTLGAFQVACFTSSSYRWISTYYYNHSILGMLNPTTWEFITYQMSTVLASVTVQTFFVYRIYSLSANPYQVLVLVQCGFGAALSVKACMHPTLEAILQECTWLAVVWYAIQATADVVIATCMCLQLHRRRTGFKKTDSAINRMILYTMSTGLITSVLSCFLLVIFAKEGFHFSLLAIGIPLSPVYSITMLANLHTRTTIRAKLATPSPLELISASIKKRRRKNAGNHGSVCINAYFATL